MEASERQVARLARGPRVRYRGRRRRAFLVVLTGVTCALWWCRADARLRAASPSPANVAHRARLGACSPCSPSSSSQGSPVRRGGAVLMPALGWPPHLRPTVLLVVLLAAAAASINPRSRGRRLKAAGSSAPSARCTDLPPKVPLPPVESNSSSNSESLAARSCSGRSRFVKIEAGLPAKRFRVPARAL